ncbi:MAG: threonine/serine exporter family protein [Oscillospiraceae bacterium]
METEKATALCGPEETGQPAEDESTSLHRVLNVAIQAGNILLENGAEIYRVEDTMKRIALHFGADNEEFFVLSNGIFITGWNDKAKRNYARVKHVPVKGARLAKVAAVNQLSREIGRGLCTLEQAEARLQEIQNMPEKPYPLQILASGVGSGCFCYLFGGSAADCLPAAIAGALLYVFVLFVSKPHLTKILGSICGGAVASLLCVLCWRLGLGESLNHMIIGSVIPLIPGVSFINGIRDLAGEDYLSGAVRLLDAILIFVCIAVGVGIVITFFFRSTGGGLT